MTSWGGAVTEDERNLFSYQGTGTSVSYGPDVICHGRDCGSSRQLPSSKWPLETLGKLGPWRG